MPTYTIVDSTKSPLDPGEIHAGTIISVSDGDVFIIDPTADQNVTFAAASGSPSFDIQINVSNTSTLDLNFGADLTPSIVVADNVDASNIGVVGNAADAINFTAGNNVTFGKYDGTDTGADTIVIGDGFTTNANWTMDGGNDSITIGDNATMANLDTGAGHDTIVFGNGADLGNIDTKEGSDSIRLGDDAVLGNIHGGDGADTFYIGNNASINNIDGSNGSDTLFTQTTGLRTNNIESTTVVCFASGTLIETPDGQREVQSLRPGDMVEIQDHGPQPIRWVHTSDHALDSRSDPARPVLISAGALGVGRPAQDLIVSPQHRILVGGHQQLLDVFGTEVFVPAKSLTSLRGIRFMNGKRHIQWVHFACDRHEIVEANGCCAESLLLGPMVQAGLSIDARRRLARIFPDGETDGNLNGEPARPCVTVGKARSLISKSKQEARMPRPHQNFAAV